MLRQPPRLSVLTLEDRLAPAVTVGVDANQSVRAIDPRIYGVAFASTAQLDDLNAPSNRWGGNTTSRYNWQLNADNRGSDWYFQSLPYPSATPGAEADSFIQSTRNAGSEAIITIPMAGHVATLGPNRTRLSSYSIAKYGPQTGNDWQWFPDAGNGIRASDGTLITWNNPLDANVASTPAFQHGWVQHLNNKWGGAASGGQRYYALDNEPSIWHHTHRDIHPLGASMAEVRDKAIAYSGIIKSVDSNAFVMGPEEFGWSGYFFSGMDLQYGETTGDWGNLPDRKANGGQYYMDSYLSGLKAHDTANGTRTLDAFTLHYYPQGGEFNNGTSTAEQQLRNRSTRALWDTAYVNESWIAQAGPDNGIVRLIPRMRQWVDGNYLPNTQIGITEYNWGAEHHMNGATTQADIWGIFAREGLDLANRWTTPPTNSPTYLAMKLWRNYDGQDNGFGDVNLKATVPNADQVSAYASRRSSDGALVVVVVNKNVPGTPNAEQAVTVNLANFAHAGTAQHWRLAAVGGNATVGAISNLTAVGVAGNSFTYTAPAQTVSLFVIPATVQPAPAVQTTQVNSGAAQRSRVESLTVTFNERVVFGANALQVARTSGAAVPFTLDTSLSTATQTVARITFASPLTDGSYKLTVERELTLDTGGRGMDADYAFNFHRLFGDSDGNGSINFTDFLAFRSSFGKSDPVFDSDGNGTVNFTDFLQFRSRFGTSVAP